MKTRAKRGEDHRDEIYRPFDTYRLEDQLDRLRALLRVVDHLFHSDGNPVDSADGDEWLQYGAAVVLGEAFDTVEALREKLPRENGMNASLGRGGAR
jgi:hypothetical protein